MADSPIGERRGWAGNIVVAVAAIDGWVFVTHAWGGRPFSIAYAVWVDLKLYPASESGP